MTIAPSRAPEVDVAPSRPRRVLLWVGIAIAILVVGAVGASLSNLGSFTERDAMDPESPGPNGTRALAEILRDRGIEVVVTDERLTALTALSEQDSTLVLPDSPALSDDAVRELGTAAMDLVLIDPRSRTLRLFLPGSEVDGVRFGTLIEPSCELAEAQRAGGIAPGTVFEPGGGPVSACYATESGAGLLVGEDGTHRISAVDGRALFVNSALADNGNAALALNLMGRYSTVVWYVPTLADTDLPNAEPTLGELTPPWVSPAIVLLLAAGLAAGIWRGRRFGPLVAERLPVTVRASETTEGRARLYAGSRDATHAADQLRIAALERIGRDLGLGPAAGVDEIVDAISAQTGRDRASIRTVLVDDMPRSDADLISLYTRLSDLEGSVHASQHPERNTR
ncbi:DUF4350 domain-containing protein [Microbacterium lacus]|uniref:DUF4350 domain-containing protein n=1 Tax=Microbacterium lacus TaxID=415217 RepID=UPI00384DA2A1